MSLIEELVNNSIEAMQCAVELHNKPSLIYRYQTVSVLFCNARELLLKAYILEEGLANEETIKDIDFGLNDCMNTVSTKKGNGFALTFVSLEILRHYRNNSIHFIGGNLDQDILEALLRNIECYTEFLQDEFGKKLFSPGTFYILPIGMPHLTEFSGIEQPSTEQKDLFQKYIANQNNKLQKHGITESVTIQVNIELINQKHSSDSDLKISTHNDGVATAIIKTAYLEGPIEISDKGAHTIKIEDDWEEFRKIYKYDSSTLCYTLYNEYYQKYTINNKRINMHNVIKNIPNDDKYIRIRYGDPDRQKQPKKFYTEQGLKFCEEYIKKNGTSFNG